MLATLWYHHSTLRNLLVYAAIAASLVAGNWPQAAGPEGTWRLPSATSAPVSWSVALDKNIVWRTPMPNGGQSGVAVWGDRLFLTTFPEYKAGDPKFSAVIMGHCVDAKTGKILWSVRLEGSVKSPMMYAYSDSTSPSPATDGKHVWFTNNSGEMACFDFKGKEIWRRKFQPWGEPYPFNKQHEPILFGNQIINVEPLDGAPPAKAGWNYLRGIDKNTGKTLWIAEDGTTTYCTSVFGKLPNG
ncbi:MAG: hypothetical protein JWO80_3184, partial [Bryobacterales bacterium]|nr:hypothetical protein [Bryobacterales bacterium]